MDTLEALEIIFRDIFLRDDICLEPETSASDVEGWDSFRHIEIILAAEIEFGVRFRSSELDAMKNVGDLIRSIERHAKSA